jgi:hypothetical protein
MKTIKRHIWDVHKIQECAEEVLYLEPNCENIKTLTDGYISGSGNVCGKFLISKTARVKVQCIEDKHENLVLKIKDICFSTNPGSKRNPYKVYLKVTLCCL